MNYRIPILKLARRLKNILPERKPTAWFDGVHIKTRIQYYTPYHVWRRRISWIAFNTVNYYGQPKMFLQIHFSSGTDKFFEVDFETYGELAQDMALKEADKYLELKQI